MTAFLLTISFLLHIISIIAIFFLFHQLSEQKDKQLTEVSDLFEHYLAEIKEENERLLAHFDRRQKEEQPVQSTSVNQAKVNEEDNQLPSFTNEQLAATEDKLETSLQAQILQLHEQGLTVDQIAKQLNCGKTEAELIINLHQKKIDKT